MLGALEDELAPLRLPAELRDLYRAMELDGIALGPGGASAPFAPWFAGLSLGWWLWRAMRDRPGLMPEALLPVVSYRSVMQLVQLADEASPGGRVFEWRRGAGGLEACYPSVSAWLDVMADLVLDDTARTLDLGAGTRWLIVSEVRERELRQERAAPATGGLVARDPGMWPERWRTASRAFDDRRPRRHRELSISEFLWESPDAATVSGVLTRGVSRPGPARVRLADGTGWLDVWCPADLPGLWLTGRQTAVELDVTAGASDWPRPEAEHPEGAPYAPQATATALRLRTFG